MSAALLAAFALGVAAPSPDDDLDEGDTVQAPVHFTLTAGSDILTGQFSLEGERVLAPHFSAFAVPWYRNTATVGAAEPEIGFGGASGVRYFLVDTAPRWTFLSFGATFERVQAQRSGGGEQARARLGLYAEVGYTVLFSDLIALSGGVNARLVVRSELGAASSQLEVLPALRVRVGVAF